MNERPHGAHPATTRRTRPNGLVLGLALLATACGRDSAPAEPAARATSIPAPPPPAPLAPNPTPGVEPAAPADEVPTGPIPGSLPGDAVRAFQVTVRRPGRDATALDSRTSKGTVVYVINSTTCSFCRDYVERLKEIEAKYMTKGIDVIHLYPNRGETDAEKIAWHAKQGFRGGQVLDTDAVVAKRLEAEKTPTVYVVDAKHVIVYRGGIDDSAGGDAVTERPLADALDAILAGKPVAVPSYETPG